jgi:hypothetical protein
MGRLCQLIFVKAYLVCKFCLKYGGRQTPEPKTAKTNNKLLCKVVRKLRNHPFAQVRFPHKHKMREYADMVQLREPEVDDINGFMDGVSFSYECTDE